MELLKAMAAGHKHQHATGSSQITWLFNSTMEEAWQQPGATALPNLH